MAAYPIEKQALTSEILAEEDTIAIKNEEALPAYTATESMSVDRVPVDSEQKDWEAGLLDCCVAGHRMGEDLASFCTMNVS